MNKEEKIKMQDSVKWFLDSLLYKRRLNAQEEDIIELGQKVAVENMKGLDDGGLFGLNNSLYYCYNSFNFLADSDEDKEIKKESVLELYSSILAAADDYPKLKSTEKLFETQIVGKIDILIESPDFRKLMLSQSIIIKNKIEELFNERINNKDNYIREPFPKDVIETCETLFDLDNRNYQAKNEDEIAYNISNTKNNLKRKIGINPTENYVFLSNTVRDRTDYMLFDKKYFEEPEDISKKIVK